MIIPLFKKPWRQRDSTGLPKNHSLRDHQIHLKVNKVLKLIMNDFIKIIIDLKTLGSLSKSCYEGVFSIKRDIKNKQIFLQHMKKYISNSITYTKKKGKALQQYF